MPKSALKISEEAREAMIRRIAIYRSGSVKKYNEDADERATVQGYVDVVILGGWGPESVEEPSLFERVFGRR